MADKEKKVEQNPKENLQQINENLQRIKESLNACDILLKDGGFKIVDLEGTKNINLSISGPLAKNIIDAIVKLLNANKDILVGEKEKILEEIEKTINK